MPADSVQQPKIQNHTNIVLTQLDEEVLILLFATYKRLVLKAEFGGGFGGGRVLLVRPISTNGADLPTVVKLGPADIIQEEWQAFARYVANKVPKVARVEGEPVFTPDERWGAVRYPLAGDGRFHCESLGAFSLKMPATDVSYVLRQQLFPSLGTLWEATNVIPEFFLARSLDAILPVNLVLSYRANSPTAAMLQRHQDIKIGQDVILSNYVVTEVDHQAQELTLDLPADEDDERPGGFRLRVKDVLDTTHFKAGELLPNLLIGRVEATRNSLLQTLVEDAFDRRIDLSQREINVPDVGNLPSPVAHLTNTLRKTEDVRVGVVHGDLNLENILVEYDQQSRNIYLIDFARARTDWILHDLLRLETSFWLYLVSSEMRRNGRSLADIESMLLALHLDAEPTIDGLEKPLQVLKTVRARARMYLVNHDNWTEYYQGLIVYLLGALKFKNLDKHPTAPLPKQVAFVAAATLQKLSDPAQNFAIEQPELTPSKQENGPNPREQINDEPQIPTIAQPVFTEASVSNLRHDYLAILNNKFSESELKDVCFRLNVNYEDLPGASRRDKGRELIMFLERRSMLHQLPQTIQKIRPDIELPS